MPNRSKLTPEMQEKLKNAKTPEEMLGILMGTSNRPAAGVTEELTVDDLADVAGGVPEYFIVDGEKMTPDEVIEFCSTIEKYLGQGAATGMFISIVSTYYNLSEQHDRERMENWYEAYKAGIWEHLRIHGN